jgi:ribose transport system substrate-binding protein
MKNLHFSTLRRTIAVAGAFALVATLGACSAAGAANSSDSKVKIGLAVPNQQTPFYVDIRQAAVAEAKKKNAEIVFADAKNDADTQVSQVQDFITQGVDAIIYIPAGSTAATVPVRAAQAADIPIVALDRNPEGAPADTFIATDSIAASEALGDWVIKQTGGKGDLGIVQGQIGTTPEEERQKGFTAALKDSSIKTVATQASKNWLQDESYDITTDMLQAHPDITVIFGHSDGLALGAAQAAETAGKDVLVVGFDGQKSALQAIADGKLGATITQRTVKMGHMSVDSAIKLADGGSEPKKQLLDGVLTTKDNAEQFLKTHP